jgi:hypothetical protein
MPSTECPLGSASHRLCVNVSNFTLKITVRILLAGNSLGTPETSEDRVCALTMIFSLILNGERSHLKMQLERMFSHIVYVLCS